jgi:hypothetical protein
MTVITTTKFTKPPQLLADANICRSNCLNKKIRLSRSTGAPQRKTQRFTNAQRTSAAIVPGLDYHIFVIGGCC